MSNWVHTYVEYSNDDGCAQTQNARAGAATLQTFKGNVFVIVNTAAHVSSHICTIQTILCSTNPEHRDPVTREVELNSHVFSAVTGIQSICDAVAAACNAKYPRIQGGTSFFPGRFTEYPFVVSELRELQVQKDAMLSLPLWNGQTLNQLANVLKHESPFCGVPSYGERVRAWDIFNGKVGLLRDIIEPAWRAIQLMLKSLASRAQIPFPDLIAI